MNKKEKRIQRALGTGFVCKKCGNFYAVHATIQEALLPDVCYRCTTAAWSKHARKKNKPWC